MRNRTGAITLGQRQLHQSFVARQAHVGQAQHCSIGGLGGGCVARRLCGLGGQHPDQAKPKTITAQTAQPTGRPRR